MRTKLENVTHATLPSRRVGYQTGEAPVNPDARNRLLDEAEDALQSASGGRYQAEVSFIQRLLCGLGADVSVIGLSPAELLSAVRGNGPLARDARNVLEILGLPSQRPQEALRAGDWMVRAVPGTGDVGHVSVLASDDLLTHSMLAAEGIAAESTRPGYYGLVIEAGAFPHSRVRPFARRLLDRRGRVLPNTVVLRPKYPDLGTMMDYPPDEPEPDGGHGGVEQEAGLSGEEDLEYGRILERIRQELKVPFTDPNDPGLYKRRQRLRQLFTSVPEPQTKELHARLGRKPTGDELSGLFHGRLATVTRRELLKMLEDRFPAAKAPAPSLPVPTPKKNPCQRAMGSMTQLLPWERSFLALVHDKSEADFKGVAILVGPIILPGLMAWPLDAIVKTALKGNYAITIESNIWFPRAIDTSSVSDLVWLVHESVHVVDYAVAGTEAFLKTYIQQAMVHGFKHDDIPHEKRANRIEAAAREMLARFPVLVKAIGSCDGSAMQALLTSQKDAYRAALNESMGTEEVDEVQTKELHARLGQKPTGRLVSNTWSKGEGVPLLSDGEPEGDNHSALKAHEQPHVDWAPGEAVTGEAAGRASGGAYALELDGVKIGWLSLAGGGGASGDVILEPTGPDRVVRKHLGGVKYNDIRLGIETGMSATVFQWIKAVLDRQPSRKSGAIISADVQHRERERLSFKDALIAEIGFPALDASSKDAGRIVLTLAPEFTKLTPTPSHPVITGPTAAKTQKKWLVANFRLQIDGLDTSKINRIEALTIKQKLVESAVGELRSVRKEATTLEIPNLIVTLPVANGKTWVDWHQDFVINGNSSANKEKNGTLELLGSNLQDVLFTLTFRHLGITRLTRQMPASGEGVARVKAEMYCEEIAFEPGTASA